MNDVEIWSKWVYKCAYFRFKLGISTLKNIKKGLTLQSGGLNIIFCTVGTVITLVLAIYEGEHIDTNKEPIQVKY